MSAFHRWMRFYVIFWLCFGAVAWLGIWAAQALAESGGAISSTASPDGWVDFAPVLDWVIGLAGAALLAVFGRIGRAIWVYFDVKADSEYRVYVEKALARAVEYAMTKAADFARTHSKVPMRSEMLEIALEYAVAAVPDGLRRLKLDSEKVRKLIDARLPVDPTATKR